ncbi:MAG: glycosyltransferase family 39 protein, partial [Chloroflexi bacterium]|nr:glycosyltransferase family 39 protein [Chloroflexota bacterium]
MTTPAIYAARTASPARVTPALLAVAAFALFVALSVPLLRAQPGPLSSDESLYATEGLNLALGKGFTYTTGEPVEHRGPVFPALLAVDFKLAGFSIEHAVWVPKLFALGNVLLLLLLARRLFGREAALLAAALGLVSSLPLLIGSSLFLDGVQTFFLLLTLLIL